MKRLIILFWFGLVGFVTPVSAAPININTADAKSIDAALKDIGPKKAEAIEKYRTEHGPFKTIEELANVPGIGEKTIEKNKADILLGDAAAVPANPAADKKAKK